MALILPVAASAQSVRAEESKQGTSNSSSSNTNANLNTQNNATAIKTQTKLDAKNLALCQNRERVINNVMARISDRGQKQINVIQAINDKVQAFYTNKNVSIDNYDSLMANIETKKTVAEQSMNNVRSMNGSFKCNDEDPKGIATQFKANTVAQSDSIKEYKNSVHDLVVAIKTSLNDDSTTTESN